MNVKLAILLPILYAILTVFFLASIGNAATADARLAEFAKKCQLPADSKPRIFAAADGEHWKEYVSLEKIPEPNIDWSEGAYVLNRSGIATAVQIDGSGQDFSDSSLYCFDAKGRLARIEREFTTAWGWGYAETDSFQSAKLSSHQEHYFDTTSHAVTARPAGFDDVHDAMKLKVYMAVKDLPFFRLM